MNLADEVGNFRSRRRIVTQIGRYDIGSQVDEILARALGHGLEPFNVGSDSIPQRQYACGCIPLLVEYERITAHVTRTTVTFKETLRQSIPISNGGRGAHAARRWTRTASCLPASGLRLSRRNTANRPFHPQPPI